jgi:hypothetical protein
MPEVDGDLIFEDDGPWYMGKARDEFNRRMRDAAVPGDDEDPIQVIQPICLSSQINLRNTVGS